MVRTNQVVCADSCAFISMLDGGKHRTAQEMSDCRAFFDSVTDDASPIHLIFPTMERAEILECYMPTGAMDQFDLILDRPNIEEVSIIPAISELAAEIRIYLIEAKGKDNSIFSITTEDAIVVATAIHHECEVLYTYDGARQPPLKNRRLLSLGGIISHRFPLKIEKPTALQMSF